MAIAEERRRRSDGRHRVYAFAIALLGTTLSLIAFWIHRVAPGSRLAAAMDGPPALVAGVAFTAIAVIAVWHYGRRLAELTTAYHELHRSVVQHERSEAALRESERFVRATVDAVDAMIAVLDADGVIMSVNRAWRLHGGEEEPVGPPGLGDVGTNYLAACESVEGPGIADAQRLADAIRQVSAGARGEVLIESVLPEEGRTFWSRATRFPGHGPLRVVVSHQEVPGVMRPAPAPVLGESFDALADGIPVAMFRTDGAAALGWANAAFHELVGADLAATRGQGWRDSILADDRERVAELCERVLGGAMTGAATVRVRRSDDEERICTLHLHVASDRRGAPSLVGTVLDVTEARDREDRAEALTRSVRAADERAARGEWFRRALESAPDGTFLTDATGRCTVTSRAWTRLAGGNAEGVWTEVVHPADRPGIVAAWQDACARDGDLDVEVRVGTGDEPDRWMRLRVQRLGDDGNGFAGWARDVTAHREAETALRARNAELTALADERTRERDRLHLAVRELEEADGAARERANEARRHADARIAALTTAVETNVADLTEARLTMEALRAEVETTRRDRDLARRDLETARSDGEIARVELETTRAERDALAATPRAEPLRALDELVRSLANGDEAGGRGVHLEVADEQTARVALLTDAVIDLTRAGRGPVARASIDMEALAQDVVADVRRSHPAHAAEVAIESLAPAAGDAGLLRQVLANLIENAFKSTRKASHPCIDVGSVVADGERVYYVRDNGVGFDGDQADKLFRVFERLHEPDEFDGAGVGLAVVRRIVARHGGRVWGEGRVGEGATFYFTLGNEPGSA
jgi:PAS domain S-box-containing protein